MNIYDLVNHKNEHVKICCKDNQELEDLFRKIISFNHYNDRHVICFEYNNIKSNDTSLVISYIGPVYACIAKYGIEINGRSVGGWNRYKECDKFYIKATADNSMECKCQKTLCMAPQDFIISIFITVFVFTLKPRSIYGSGC